MGSIFFKIMCSMLQSLEPHNFDIGIQRNLKMKLERPFMYKKKEDIFYGSSVLNRIAWP